LEREKLTEGPGGDALAPVLATDPVADEAPVILVPAADVPDDHAVHDDGAGDVFRAEDLGAPVGHERIALPRRECGHAQRFRVALVLEEDGQVLIGDVAEDHDPPLMPCGRPAGYGTP